MVVSGGGPGVTELDGHVGSPISFNSRNPGGGWKFKIHSNIIPDYMKLYVT